MTREDNFGAPVECAEAGNDHEQSHQLDSIQQIPHLQLLMHRALRIAAQGIAVLPLNRFGKKPHRILGASIGSFSAVATTDCEQLRGWWTADPLANIGIATGGSLVVIDVDKKDGANGLDSLIEFCDANGIDLPTATRVRTATGGMHLYFRKNGPSRSVTGWLPQVDVRAEGGLIVAPGSVRQFRDLRSREPYYVEYELEYGRLDSLPLAPDALLADIQANGGRFATVGSQWSQNASVAPRTSDLIRDGFARGGRDAGFNSLAWRLWLRHWPYEEIVRDQLYAVWLATEQTDDDPYPWRFVESKMNRAFAALDPQIRAERAWAQSFGGSHE